MDDGTVNSKFPSTIEIYTSPQSRINQKTTNENEVVACAAKVVRIVTENIPSNVDTVLPSLNDMFADLEKTTAEYTSATEENASATEENASATEEYASATEEYASAESTYASREKENQEARVDSQKAAKVEEKGVTQLEQSSLEITQGTIVQQTNITVEHVNIRRKEEGIHIATNIEFFLGEEDAIKNIRIIEIDKNGNITLIVVDERDDKFPALLKSKFAQHLATVIKDEELFVSSHSPLKKDTLIEVMGEDGKMRPLMIRHLSPKEMTKLDSVVTDFVNLKMKKLETAEDKEGLRDNSVLKINNKDHIIRYPVGEKKEVDGTRSNSSERTREEDINPGELEKDKQAIKKEHKRGKQEQAIDEEFQRLRQKISHRDLDCQDLRLHKAVLISSDEL